MKENTASSGSLHFQYLKNLPTNQRINCILIVLLKSPEKRFCKKFYDQTLHRDQKRCRLKMFTCGVNCDV